jgi:hypothetical protein
MIESSLSRGVQYTLSGGINDVYAVTSSTELVAARVPSNS